ncbi:MAG: VWA domain-containing protein [Planctomycetota bacterium]
MFRLTILLAALVVSLFHPSVVDAREFSAADAARIKKRLTIFAKAKRAVDIRGIIEELSLTDNPAAIPLLVKAALIVPSADNYEFAAQSLGSMLSNDCFKWITKTLNPKKKTKGLTTRHKLLLVMSLGYRKDKESLPLLTEQIARNDHRYRLTAIRAADRRRETPLIQPLIDLLGTLEKKKKKDRVWLETREVLYQITGQNFEAHEDWVKYWETAKANFDARQVGKADSKTLVKLGGVKFFGKTIHSHNLIFIIDTSFSMVKYDLNDEYKGNKPSLDLRRIRRAQRQLVTALRSLPTEAYFNVVGFSNKVIPFKKKMCKATRSNVENAIRYIKTMKPNGDTHTQEALDRAFADPNVDTIVLLSDGIPRRKGQATAIGDTQPIIDHIRNTYAGRQVRIDTFGFAGAGLWPKLDIFKRKGPPPAPDDSQLSLFEDFLKQLSEMSGGFYQTIK